MPGPNFNCQALFHTTESDFTNDILTDTPDCVIANDTNNDSLFAGVKINGQLSATQQNHVDQPVGTYAAGDFFSLIKTAVEENWIENGVMTHEK